MLTGSIYICYGVSTEHIKMIEYSQVLTSESENNGSEPESDSKQNNTSSTTDSSLDIDEITSSQPNPNGASIISCAINLANTVAGAGMLGLPGAYAGSGIITGTILLCVAGFFSANGLRLLSISANTVGITKSKPSSFYAVASAALPEFTILIDAAVAIKCFGVATGYFITVGDCMVDAMEYFLGVDERHAGGGLGHDSWEDMLISRHFWVLSGLIFVLPISFFKTLEALKFASTLSLILIYALAIMIVLYASGVFDSCEGMTGVNENAQVWRENSKTDSDQSCKGEVELVTSISSTLKNLAIFVFSFTCHQNIFAITNEIRNRTQQRIDKVISIAIGSSLLLYFTVAVEGYRTYGSQVDGDILVNYPQTAPVTVMRIFIAVMVILSYPLQLDPSRRCITSLIKEVGDRKRRRRQVGVFNDEDTEAGDELFEITHDNHTEENCNETVFVQHTTPPTIEENEEEQQLMQRTTQNFIFYGITCTFLVLSFIIAMIVSDLGVILSIVGATGSTMVSYILPGAIYIKLHPGFHFLKLLAYLQLILGCLIVPTALFFVIFYGASA